MQSIVRTAHRYAPKVAAGASAPSPSPSPVAGEGPSGQVAACSNFSLGSVTSRATLLGKSQSRTPTTATPFPSKFAQQIPAALSQQSPLFMQSSPRISPFCKSSVNKSEILTFQLQKRGDLQGLVKGLFLTGKKVFPVGLSPRTINREPFRPNGQTGVSVQNFSADLIGQFGGLPQREPASHQYLEN